MIDKTLEIKTRPEREEEREKSGVAPEITIETKEDLKRMAEAEMTALEKESRDIMVETDEQIKSANVSIGLPQEQADEIYQRGFAGTVQSIKEKITEVVKSCKEKIGSFFGMGKQGRAESVAEEIKKEEVVKEKKVETSEEKEQRELKEYLEKEAYPSLGISVKDREWALAGAPEEKREALERSFENIRAITKSYFEIETIKGRVEGARYKKDFEKKWAEESKKKLLEMGLGEEDIEKLGITEEKVYFVREEIREIKEDIKESLKSKVVYEDIRPEPIFLEILKKQENNQLLSKKEGDYMFKFSEKIYEKARDKVRAIQEKKSELEKRGLYSEIVEKIGDARPYLDLEPYKIRRSKEEVLKELLVKTKEIKKNNFITINIKPEKLMSAVEIGKFKRVSELSEKERLQHFRELSGTEAMVEFYSTQRNATEEAVSAKDAIYGCYGYENRRDEIRGGAPVYGDIFLKFKPDVLNRTVYFPGDSLAGNHTESFARQLQERNVDRNDYADFAKKRAISIEHAPIAKAILDKERRVSSIYMEAAIVKIEGKKDLTIDDVESINIPLIAIEAAREEHRKLIDQLLEDPKLSNKIIILDEEGRRYKKREIEVEMWSAGKREKKTIYESYE